MSKPESKVGDILKAIDELKELMTKLDTKVNALTKEVNDLKDSCRTDNDLVQTSFTQLKESMNQVLAGQSGAKKTVKAAEDKAPTDGTSTPKETKVAKEPKVAEKKETRIEFFKRMTTESPEFKAKYATDEIEKQCTNNRSKCKCLTAIDSNASLANLKADFDQEYKNYKPTSGSTTETKDEL